MKYRCLIVDDEPIAQQILEKVPTPAEELHRRRKSSGTAFNTSPESDPGHIWKVIFWNLFATCSKTFSRTFPKQL
jgi:hypothetical protein